MTIKKDDDVISIKNKENKPPILSGHEIKNKRTSNAVGTSTGKPGKK